MKNLNKKFAAGFLAMAIVIGQGAMVNAATQNEMVDMISEEMTANALYTSLSEKYPEYQVFANLAKSEARHTEALKKSAARLGLDVTAAKAGDLPSFATKEEALAFAKNFEAEDIDMLKQLIEKEEDARLKRVLGNLLKGSENHYKTMEIASEEGLDSMTCSADRGYQNRSDNQGQKGGQGNGGQALGQANGQGQNANGGQRNQDCDGTCDGTGQGTGQAQKKSKDNKGQGSGQARNQDNKGQASKQGGGQARNQSQNDNKGQGSGRSSQRSANRADRKLNCK